MISNRSVERQKSWVKHHSFVDKVIMCYLRRGDQTVSNHWNVPLRYDYSSTRVCEWLYLPAAAAAAAAAAAEPPAWAGGGTAVPPGRRQRGRWLTGRRRKKENRWAESSRWGRRSAANSKQHLTELHPPTDPLQLGEASHSHCDSFCRAAGYLHFVIYVHVLTLGVDFHLNMQHWVDGEGAV